MNRPEKTRLIYPVTESTCEGMPASLEKQTKKSLLLVSHPRIYQVVEAALDEAGCHVYDDLDAASEVDFVVMDSFYLKSGTAEFIKKKNEQMLTLLVMLQNEPAVIQSPAVNKIDDAIVLEPGESLEKLLFSCVDWFRNAWSFSSSSVQSKEFGSGLWTSLMLRLASSEVRIFPTKERGISL